MKTGTLESYYKTNHELSMEYGYSLSELDNMIPFEREVYIMLINEKLEEKEKNRNS